MWSRNNGIEGADYRTAWRRAGVLALVLCCGGCVGSPPDCGGAEVSHAISDLFRRQFKLTPYVRYIDFAKSKLTVEAVFSIRHDAASQSCVAFVTYTAELNEEGQRAERRKDLTYSLLYELENEKQVYYRVSEADGGHVRVQIERVGG